MLALLFFIQIIQLLVVIFAQVNPLVLVILVQIKQFLVVLFVQVNPLVLLSVSVSGVCPSEPINSSHARFSNIVSVSVIHPSKLASENIPFSNKPFLIFLTSAFFFTKNQHFHQN